MQSESDNQPADVLWFAKFPCANASQVVGCQSVMCKEPYFGGHAPVTHMHETTFERNPRDNRS